MVAFGNAFQVLVFVLTCSGSIKADTVTVSPLTVLLCSGGVKRLIDARLTWVFSSTESSDVTCNPTQLTQVVGEGSFSQTATFSAASFPFTLVDNGEGFKTVIHENRVEQSLSSGQVSSCTGTSFARNTFHEIETTCASYACVVRVDGTEFGRFNLVPPTSLATWSVGQIAVGKDVNNNSQSLGAVVKIIWDIFNPPPTRHPTFAPTAAPTTTPTRSPVINIPDKLTPTVQPTSFIADESGTKTNGFQGGLAAGLSLGCVAALASGVAVRMRQQRLKSSRIDDVSSENPRFDDESGSHVAVVDDGISSEVAIVGETQTPAILLKTRTVETASTVSSLPSFLFSRPSFSLNMFRFSSREPTIDV